MVVDRPEPNGQRKLQPDHFFVITNWGVRERGSYELLDHYRGRGTFEDRFGEVSQAIGAHLSSPAFAENEANLLLALLAFNLANIPRAEIESASEDGWDLLRFQRSVLKAGARMVKGGHCLWFDLAAAVAPLWQRLLARIRRWRRPERWAKRRAPRPQSWMPPPAHAHLSLVLRL